MTEWFGCAVHVIIKVQTRRGLCKHAVIIVGFYIWEEIKNFDE